MRPFGLLLPKNTHRIEEVINILQEFCSSVGRLLVKISTDQCTGESCKQESTVHTPPLLFLFCGHRSSAQFFVLRLSFSCPKATPFNQHQLSLSPARLACSVSRRLPPPTLPAACGHIIIYPQQVCFSAAGVHIGNLVDPELEQQLTVSDCYWWIFSGPIQLGGVVSAAHHRSGT